MYTDEQFEQLEQEEREITEEAVLVMLAILALTKSSLEKELRAFYQQYGKNGVVTWQNARRWVSNKDHRRRLTVLLSFMSEQFDTLYEKLTPEFHSFLFEVVGKELDFFDVEDATIDKDKLFTAWGVDDSTWDERLKDDINLWLNRVANDVKQSILRQDDIEEVVDNLTDTFDSMERVLKRLSMTESTAAGSMARKEIFKRLGIEKYRYYARIDERTCDVCGSLHGLVFPLSSFEIGVNASPMHPWCRCWEVPIVD